MKKTTSSLFAATAALGLIAASAGVAFTAEAPTTEPSTPSVPAADQGGAGAASGPVDTTGVTTRGQISTGNGPAPSPLVAASAT